ncbi:autotransporter assembly complex protein TamA [Falsirhodobacter algicola]|uniref:BamA/TamA family outer membrane protein n=1 Tax=Falsirhodobacter algicola TaxID=2692330 RepID=A0A8J8SL08_9RHOB|nr:autotransporter assembly complex family protein [Falsirhodobacter algicola]QUS36057.1 BamA/TamA family outer membrane protein [Falsirhodobacter algicola]
MLTLAAALGVTTGGTAQALDQVVFQVTGNDDDITETLRNASLTAEVAEDPDRTDELFGAAQADYGRLVGALYAIGRYSPVIHITIDGREAASIAPLYAPAADTIREIRITVDPGPEFRFSRAVVTPYVEGTEFPDGFAEGEVAESGLISDAVKAGLEKWRDIGHAKADVAEERIIADHRADTLLAEVALTPGPRLRFGPMTVQGQRKMSARRIEKIAGLPEGETYSPEELQTAANRLRRTGIFSSVTMTEGEVAAPDLLPITTTVVEQLPRRYSIGAEISSSEGASLTSYWLHRNLLGGGERLRVDGAVENIGAQNSGMDYSLGVTLERPATITADTTAAVNAGIEHLDEEDYTSDGFDIGISFTQIISEDLTASLGLTYAQSDVEDDLGDYTYKTLSLPLGVTWDTRDNELDATEGFYLAAVGTPFAGAADTDSGFRATLDGRGYYSFGEPRRLTLAGRMQAGRVWGPDLLGTPRDFLFYSGGGGTVRGQPYQSLGVYPSDDDDDYKIGGSSFLAASVEARVMVTDNIGLVGFFDAGRIGTDGFSDMDEQSGAGFGLRYNTGVGPIRLDIASPVSGDTGEGVQIYVGIGQAF